MLISKEVEVRVVGITLSHYRKFYKNIKCGDKIRANVLELPYNSRQTIQVKCDICGEIYDFKYGDYNKNKKDVINAKYECRKCEIDRIWNNVIDKCKELNFELLTDKVDYKTHKTYIKFICNYHKGYGIQKVSVNSLLTCGSGCKLCSNLKKSKARRLDFNIVASEFIARDYILLETKYKNARQKLKYICSKHPDIIRTITFDKLRKGQGCMECGNEKISNYFRHDIEHVKQCFVNKNLIYIEENEYINNQTPLKYLCKKHIDKGEQIITLQSLKVSKFGCNYCASEYRAELLNKGGITPVHNYLRGKIDSWNKDSMENCNYKCIITGSRFDTVHHVYGFNLILFETFDILNLPIYSNISQYSEGELFLLEETCLKLHYKYGLGVCLSNSIHELFHKLYSKGDNTPQQFDDFKLRLKSGEFNNFLDENNLKLII